MKNETKKKTHTSKQNLILTEHIQEHSKSAISYSYHQIIAQTLTTIRIDIYDTMNN